MHLPKGKRKKRKKNGRYRRESFANSNTAKNKKQKKRDNNEILGATSAARAGLEGKFAKRKSAEKIGLCVHARKYYSSVCASGAERTQLKVSRSSIFAHVAEREMP